MNVLGNLFLARYIKYVSHVKFYFQIISNICLFVVIFTVKALEFHPHQHSDMKPPGAKWQSYI